MFDKTLKRARIDKDINLITDKRKINNLHRGSKKLL